MPHYKGQVEARLTELNIQLELPPKPSGNYVSYTMVSPLIFLSGVTPKENGVLKYKGKVGLELTKEEGYQAARQCIINQLSTLRSALGDLDRVVSIVKLEGFIHAAPDFYELPYVLNGASDLLVEVFGKRRRFIARRCCCRGRTDRSLRMTKSVASLIHKWR